MTAETLALVALLLAALPLALFLVNLTVYRPPPSVGLPTARNLPAVSVLIPARNESANIGAAIASALHNDGLEFEVVVLDDHSEDDTATIVQDFARRDPRVRLASAPPLPAGWCGKQHACHVLAGLARHPWLVFMDADVRLEPGALARLAAWVEPRRVDLASGVPRQVTGTWLEKLLIPLVHLILLGYLPMPFMRWFRSAAFAAGCGQLFIARAAAYARAGGHAAIRSTLHDGLRLPKAFRRAGLRTDLFDATDVAACRMYHDAAEVWRGLGKNAVEGIAAPALIGPWTLLLAGGHVLPFVLLLAAPGIGTQAFALAATAAGASLVLRGLAAWRFRQPFAAVPVHPLAVTLFLIIQWQALGRHLRRDPPTWKGRRYPGTSPAADASLHPPSP